MVAPQLWQPRHTSQHRQLAERVLRMHDEAGYDFNRIAEELDGDGLRSPRGKRFYPKLVRSMYVKWKRRLLLEGRVPTVALEAITLAST